MFGAGLAKHVFNDVKQDEPSIRFFRERERVLKRPKRCLGEIESAKNRLQRWWARLRDWRRDGQHRDGCASQYLLSDRAQEEPLEAASAMGTESQQVRRPPFGFASNFLGRVSLFHDDVYVLIRRTQNGRAVPAHFLCNRVDLLRLRKRHVSR